MIDTDLDKLSTRAGGRFRLCSLVIRRARAMVTAQTSGEVQKLNSQIIRQVLSEVEGGQLLLKTPEGMDKGSAREAPKGTPGQ
jgi:DNA-directed RNA polymerase subunit K/omega